MDTEVFLFFGDEEQHNFNLSNERRNTKRPVELYRPILKESPPTGTARERVTANWVSVPPTKHTPRLPVRPAGHPIWISHMPPIARSHEK